MNDEFYSKEFIYGSSSLSRGELESLPCPFCTENVTDEQMEAIVRQTELETKAAMGINSNESLNMKDNRTSEVWWEEMEAAVRQQGIPYQEDKEYEFKSKAWQ